MRKVLFGVVMSLVVGGVAYAEDYIVVQSSDARIPRSATFSSGERVYLGHGHTMTVVNSAGTSTTYQGRAGGIVMPAAPTSAGADNRIAGLMSILQRPQRRTFGAMRGGRYKDADTCPAAADLTTVDAIIEADKAGCVGASTAAMEALSTRQN